MKNTSVYNNQLQNTSKRIIFLFKAQKYELAIKEAEELLVHDSTNYTALYYMASCYYSLKTPHKAADSIQKLIENYPQNSRAYGLYGRMFLNTGKYRKAIEYCKKAIELDPNDAYNYYIMSFSLKKIGGKENLCIAVGLIQKALEIEPSNEELHIHACAVYIHIGEYYKARKEGEKALQLNPESSRAHLNYGCSLIYLGYLYEALNEFYTCIEFNPNDKQAIKNIAIVREYTEKPEKYYRYLEKRFFNRDLKMENNSKAFLILAELLIKEKRYFDALRVFKRYLNINPKSVDEHIKYAKMLYDEGALAEALHYLKALKLRNLNKNQIDEYISRISSEIKEFKIKKIYFCI